MNDVIRSLSKRRPSALQPSSPSLVVMHGLVRTSVIIVTSLATAMSGAGLSTAYAAQPGDYLFEQQIGSRGNQNGQLLFPGIAAPDADRNVYVADTGNHRVQEFGASGALLRQWGGQGSGDGQFQFPTSLALDASQHLYVVDQRNNRIQKFTGTGVYELKWGGQGTGPGQFDGPQGIAIAPDGSVYVADTGNHRIQRFNAAGTYLGEWGTAGHGNGQFGTPYGVAVDALGSVYVADSGNHRVQRFDAQGEFLGKWGMLGAEPGQFDFPDGIAVDESGDVFVSDSRNSRVQKFSGTGAFLTQFGVQGDGPGRMSGPLGISVGSAGRLYVADLGNHRVQVFRAARPAIVSAGPPARATVGQRYSARIEAAAFPAVGSFTLASGTVPPGLSLDSDGRLTGMPRASGSYTFAIRANNTVLPAATTSFTITVASPAVFTSGLPARATVGKRYTGQLRATASPVVTSFTVVAGKLPPGLKLSSSGKVAGRPTRSGKYSISIRANNSAQPSTIKRFTITVKPK